MRLSLLFGAWLTSRAVMATPQQTLNSLLQNPSNNWSPKTVISTPDTPWFENFTVRWSVYKEPTFRAAISPATEADVAKAVKLANKANIPFLATGGRHAIASTFETLKNGLAIDLHLLNKVTVDAKARTVTVSGGNRFGDVFNPVGDAGFMIQTGSGSCPGFFGAGLGGGVGRYQGKFGLVLDALVSARLVTAQGDVIDVSATSNPDLFWAIRGAGANFGIVTSAVFKIQPAPKKILTVDFILPAASNSSYFDLLKTLEKMPPELATISFVMWNDTIQAPQILANWVYTGPDPEGEGQRLIAPVFKMNPVISSSSYVTWSKLIPTAGFGQNNFWCAPSTQPRTQLSTNVKKLDADTYRTMFEKMTAFYKANPNARGSTVELEIFNSDAMKAVPDSETAYPWRDTIAYMMFEITWTTPAAEKAAFAIAEDLRRDFVRTSGYSDISIYVNYAHGSETLEQKFGKRKLPRLAAMKKKWDPKQRFGYSNPIPTQYPVPGHH